MCMHTWNIQFLSLISAKLKKKHFFPQSNRQNPDLQDRQTDSPARSCDMQTRPSQVVWCIDLEACRQDRVITERAHYAIPPSCRGMEVLGGRTQCIEEESVPRRRQPEYQTARGERMTQGGKESKKETVWKKERQRERMLVQEKQRQCTQDRQDKHTLLTEVRTQMCATKQNNSKA